STIARFRITHQIFNDAIPKSSIADYLSCLFDDSDRFLLRLYHLARDHALPNLLLTGQRVHQVEHDVLDDHPQTARANLPAQRRLGNRFERVFREPQLDVLVLEQALVLPRDRVSGLSEDLDERGLVKLVQRADDRQAPDELRDEAVLDQVFRLELLDERRRVLARRLHVGLEAHRLLAEPARDLFVQTDEGAAADEEDVGRVDLEELLVRMLAPALRRDVGDGALEDLEQRLLHALARDVARDRRVLVLAADLVDLVDVDDALLRLLDVAARRLQQLGDGVLDV